MSGFQIKSVSHFLATGFGSGLLPKAPGTWGTVVAALIYLPMSWCLSLKFYLIVLVAASLFGVWLCEKVAKDLGEQDPPSVVWDEFCGFWLTMVAAPAGWLWLLCGFVLFRVFDIWKPWPIGLVDSKLKGGLGIMVDDLLAGVYAWIVLHLLFRIWLLV